MAMNRVPGCHPERKYYAKGLCCNCYWNARRAMSYRNDSDYRARANAACRRSYEKNGVINYYLNHDKSLATRKAYRDKLRQQVLEAYGRKCYCCGEMEEKFLALDHVNGKDPNTKRSHRSGSGLYKQARDAGFPASYQLLCHNCNSAKGFYGACPHNDRR